MQNKQIPFYDNMVKQCYSSKIYRRKFWIFLFSRQEDYGVIMSEVRVQPTKAFLEYLSIIWGGREHISLYRSPVLLFTFSLALQHGLVTNNGYEYSRSHFEWGGGGSAYHIVNREFSSHQTKGMKSCETGFKRMQGEPKLTPALWTWFRVAWILHQWLHPARRNFPCCFHCCYECRGIRRGNTVSTHNQLNSEFQLHSSFLRVSLPRSFQGKLDKNCLHFPLYLQGGK